MDVKRRSFVNWSNNILDDNIIGIDVDGLVANDQFFVFFAILGIVTHNEKITVSNIQLILPFGKELEIGWILVIHSNNEESKLFLEFVCQNVKIVLFLIVNDFLNGTNLEMLVKINLLIIDFVDVNGVLWGSNDVAVLVGIRLEELRLSIHWLFEDFFGF